MMKHLGLVCLLLFVGIRSAFAQLALTHAGWNDLLHKHVVVLRGGQTSEVDCAGFMADRTSLQTYLASASRVTRPDFDHWSSPAPLALYSGPLGLNVDTASQLSVGKLGIAFLDYNWRLNVTGEPARSGKS